VSAISKATNLESLLEKKRYEKLKIGDLAVLSHHLLRWRRQQKSISSDFK
jgi:hypothetical protein